MDDRHAGLRSRRTWRTAPAPVAIAAVGYLGAFSGPPAIGGIAGLTSLTAALALVGIGTGVPARRSL